MSDLVGPISRVVELGGYNALPDGMGGIFVGGSGAVRILMVAIALSDNEAKRRPHAFMQKLAPKAYHEAAAEA
jgi:hypothetical protein